MNHSGVEPLPDKGVAPVYAPGEEDEMGEPSYEFPIDEATKSYVRISAAALNVIGAAKAARDDVEAQAFARRVRLPGSGAVARLFGRLDAWKAVRVERKAQAAGLTAAAPVRA
jgi:hypothetical protein